MTLLHNQIVRENASPMSTINCTRGAPKAMPPRRPLPSTGLVRRRCRVGVRRHRSELARSSRDEFHFPSPSSSAGGLFLSSSLAAFRNSHRVIGPKMTLGNEKYTSFCRDSCFGVGALLFALTHRLRTQEGERERRLIFEMKTFSD